MEQNLPSSSILNIITGCSSGLGNEICKYKKNLGEEVIGFSQSMNDKNIKNINYDINNYSDYEEKKYYYIEDLKKFKTLNFYFNAAYINDETNDLDNIFDNILKSIYINFINQFEILNYYFKKTDSLNLNIYFLSSISIFNNKNNFIGYKLSKSLMYNLTNFINNKNINKVNLKIRCFVFGGILTPTYINKINQQNPQSWKIKFAISTKTALNIIEDKKYKNYAIVIRPLKTKIIYFINKFFKIF